MSNRLNIYRAVVRPCDDRGRPTDEPSYAIMASDDYESASVTFDSLAQLNAAVAEHGNNLLLTMQQLNNSFDSLDSSVVGAENFYGSVPLLFDDESLAVDAADDE